MKIIIGLGNPGRDYENSRHNVGFLAIDEIAEKHGITLNENRLKGMMGKGVIEGEKVFLVKPVTFMNNSGECVRAIIDFYKLTADDVIIIYDDVDLEPGQLRIREHGSAGSHNGMKSIIKHLGTEAFVRIRVGVGAKPEGWDLADYVLAKLTGETGDATKTGIKKAAEALDVILKKGISDAMNEFNRKEE